MFKNTTQINKDLVGVEMRKANIELNKTISVGVAILDLAKLHMYQFFYDVVKKKYGNDVELVYTDTDSFILNIMTDDIYEDLEETEFNNYFDFSDYSKEHELYNKNNKKVLGKFKDELNGKLMTEFIALSPKCYSYKIGEKSKCLSKGVPKSIVKKSNYEIMEKRSKIYKAL